MSTGLCIIDMQYGFRASKNLETIYNVIKEIQKAKKSNLPIINVELDPKSFEKTCPIIKEFLKDYNKVFNVRKDADDGSAEIIRKIKAKKLEIKTIRLVGVNIDACVISTATGLARNNINVKIVQKACNSENSKGINAAWKVAKARTTKNIYFV